MMGIGVLLFSVLLIQPLSGFSLETRVLKSGKSVNPLENSLYYNAGTHPVKPEQIVKFLNDDVFTPVSGSLNRGFSQDVYWVVFSVKNETAEKNLSLETGSSFIEELEYYFLEVSDEGRYSLLSGINTDFRWNKQLYSQSVTPLNLDTGESGIILLRLKSYPVQLRARIMSERNFVRQFLLEFTARGVYYGLLLSLVVFSLFRFLLNRRKEYIFYFIYLICFSFFQLSHDGYLLPMGAGFLLNRRLILLSESLCILSGLYFQRYFAGARVKNFPHALFNALAFLTVLLIAASFITPQNLFVYPSVVSTSLIVVFSFSCLGAALLQKKSPGNHVYMYHSLAWIVLFIGFLIFSLKQFGVLPLNFITTYSTHFASGIEFFLLFFAMAEREKHLQNEKEKSLLLENKNKTLLSLSTTDSMTGLFNRMKSEEILSSEIRESARYNYPLCVALLDIDYFKKINDTFGHPAGDSVLREFAEILGENIRQSDFAGRWGGEEFVLIIPHVSLEGAVKMSEKLIHIIREYSFPEVGHCTASLGLAQLIPGELKQDFIKRVDQLLYSAKDRGRNRISY